MKQFEQSTVEVLKFGMADVITSSATPSGPNDPNAGEEDVLQP